MSLSSSAKCSVHVETRVVYPGDPVEGYVTVEVTRPFPVRNVHIKIVGKERVHTMVDHVSQSKTHDTQFGIASQDYVYYREITTLVGGLLSVAESSAGSASRRSTALLNASSIAAAATAAAAAGGAGRESPAAATASVLDESEVLSFTLDSFVTAPETVNDNSDRQVNRCFAIAGASMLAALEGSYVTLPRGTFTFPFRYLLPAELPPSYDTGVKVLNKQFSNSRSRMSYYVKLYVLSDKKLLASSSAFFVVKPMQPVAANRSFLLGGSRDRRLTSEARVVECRFDVRPNALGGCCCGGCGDDDGRALVVRMMLERECYEIDKDEIAVVCVIAKNTTGKRIQGVRLSLIQSLTFHTVKAEVPMCSTVLSKDTLVKVEPNEERKCITATLPKVPVREGIMPTMCTTGLAVDYDVRVDVLVSTRTVSSPSYTFRGVVLAAPADAMAAAPPFGEMRFAALPRGRLSSREAYYAVPMNPVVEPQLPIVSMRVTGPATL